MSSAVKVLDCEQETKINTNKTSGIVVHRVSRIEAAKFPKWPPPLTCASYCDRSSKSLYQHGHSGRCGDINVLSLAHSGTYRVDQTDHTTLAHFGACTWNLSRTLRLSASLSCRSSGRKAHHHRYSAPRLNLGSPPDGRACRGRLTYSASLQRRRNEIRSVLNSWASVIAGLGGRFCCLSQRWILDPRSAGSGGYLRYRPLPYGNAHLRRLKTRHADTLNDTFRTLC
jgi:hypothetical protein